MHHVHATGEAVASGQVCLSDRSSGTGDTRLKITVFSVLTDLTASLSSLHLLPGLPCPCLGKRFTGCLGTLLQGLDCVLQRSACMAPLQQCAAGQAKRRGATTHALTSTTSPPPAARAAAWRVRTTRQRASLLTYRKLMMSASMPRQRQLPSEPLPPPPVEPFCADGTHLCRCVSQTHHLSSNQT